MSEKVLCVSKTDMRNALKLGLDIENILTYSLFIDIKSEMAEIVMQGVFLGLDLDKQWNK